MNYIDWGSPAELSEKESSDTLVKDIVDPQTGLERTATVISSIPSKYSDISLIGENLINHDAVMQGVYNIIHTRVGERLFNRNFGSAIEDFLFEPFTFLTTRMILSELLGSITRNDYRVEVVTNQTDVKMNVDTRRYEITLAIKVKGLDEVLYYNENLSPKDNKN